MSDNAGTADDSTNEAASAVAVDEPVVTVSDAALAMVLDVRTREDDPTSVGLRIAVTGTQGPEYTYDLSFEAVDEGEETDVRYVVGDLTVLIPADSVQPLRGATLDVPSARGQGGLVIRNPNRPNPLAGMTLQLTGDVADKVNQLLSQQINPALAAHGGFATLVGVDGEKVFVTMGGGCQGCAMSRLTLVEGIQAAILEAIPEVTEVVDATDHQAGENPYY